MSDKKSMANTIRLQIEIGLDQARELEHLQKLGGLKSSKELFNNAITLLKWAAKERAQGAVIYSVSEDDSEYKELLMPFLETYATNTTHDIRLSTSKDIKDSRGILKSATRRKVKRKKSSSTNSRILRKAK